MNKKMEHFRNIIWGVRPTVPQSCNKSNERSAETVDTDRPVYLDVWILSAKVVQQNKPNKSKKTVFFSTVWGGMAEKTLTTKSNDIVDAFLQPWI